MTIPIDVPIWLDIQNPEPLRQINHQVVRVVHERDHYTCRCCGLRSTRYQQVLNPGGNWRDINTITTACIFCQQCLSLDSVALMRSGRLIAFPPIEQTDLNRLAIEIYMARMSGEKIQQADACLDMLMSTREITRNHLGTDDPKELARMLHECKTDEERHVVNAKMAGVRLFPLDRRIVQEANLEYNAFMQISAFWCSPSGPYPQNWGGPLPRFERFCETYL